MLRCATVHGLEPELVGFEFSSDQGPCRPGDPAARACPLGRFSQLPDSVRTLHYRGYASAILLR